MNKDDFGWSTTRRGSFWRQYRLEGLLVVALLMATVLTGFTTHPGLHVAGVTALLDLMVWKREHLQHSRQLVWLGLLNLLAVLVIAFGSDAVELWLTGFYGIYTILLLAVPRPSS